MMTNIKKKKVQKSVIKRKLRFRDYNSYLRASQIENIIKSLEKN